MESYKVTLYQNKSSPLAPIQRRKRRAFLYETHENAEIYRVERCFSYLVALSFGIARSKISAAIKTTATQFSAKMVQMMSGKIANISGT